MIKNEPGERRTLLLAILALRQLAENKTEEVWDEVQGTPFQECKQRFVEQALQAEQYEKPLELSFESLMKQRPILASARVGLRVASFETSAGATARGSRHPQSEACTCTYTYTYMQTCTCTRTYAYTSTYKCTRTPMLIFIWTYRYT